MVKSASSQAERPVAVSDDTTDGESQTLTRVNLAEAVYRSVGLSRKESAALVQMVLSELSDTLVKGETVKLSSFGSFIIRSKAERIGRNPKTGIEVPITQRRVLVFKPSNVLKAKVNGHTVVEEDD
ncbi:integration host factor subunit alpha [Beijerinckia indica]|uniref:Integration host factor subunit alpha n=1 Tax=Beijerinckia indica subsp. indica (strain ATCC 9039 / DSM 1715 / NCIMB 8712) TaxID=395963 RepID=B2IEJ3_BEII9|nr:integration host factor subunit alpha [Beijerinckia indica]ACB96935.1 integration host factor, alpha subunit [Beijerinckia indica subsp. indica ATCC 9039]